MSSSAVGATPGTVMTTRTRVVLKMIKKNKEKKTKHVVDLCMPGMMRRKSC